jgi:hypothetical protein
MKEIYELSLANHSANEDSVSCNFNEKRLIPSGNLLLILLEKSTTIFSLVGW